MRRLPARVLPLVALALAACAGDEGPEVATVAADPSDSCSPLRQPLVDAQEDYITKLAVPVVSTGAFSGLLKAAQTGKIDRSAAAAGVQTLTAAATAYLESQQQQHGSRDLVLEAIGKDVDGTRDHASGVAGAARALNFCRSEQAAELRQRISTGALQPEAGRQRLETLRERITEDRRLINEALGEVETDAEIYAEVTALTEGVERDLVLSEETRAYEPVVLADPRGARGIGLRYTTREVALRADPAEDARAVETVPAGTELLIVGEGGVGWSLVDRDDRRGAYVPVTALQTQPPAPPEAAGAQPSELPIVDRSKQPVPETDLDALYTEAANIRAEDTAFEAQISDELAALEALVQ